MLITVAIVVREEAFEVSGLLVMAPSFVEVASLLLGVDASVGLLGDDATAFELSAYNNKEVSVILPFSIQQFPTN